MQIEDLPLMRHLGENVFVDPGDLTHTRRPVEVKGRPGSPYFVSTRSRRSVSVPSIPVFGFNGLMVWVTKLPPQVLCDSYQVCLPL